MTRLNRLTHTLIQLQSRRLVTARQIADRFEVSLRTVYRDIRALREAGVPIGEEEGKGYFLVSGYSLPPVVFSPEEAAALAAVEKILGYNTDLSLKTHFDSAMMKIRAVMDEDDLAKVEFLNDHIGIASLGLPETNSLATIQEAIVEGRLLKIAYHSGRKDELTERMVEPYGLYFNVLKWYVVGHCHLRDDLREFRLDRIQRLSLTGETFEIDPNFRINDYLKVREKKLFPTPDTGLSSPPSNL